MFRTAKSQRDSHVRPALRRRSAADMCIRDARIVNAWFTWRQSRRARGSRPYSTEETTHAYLTLETVVDRLQDRAATQRREQT
jgi:hypothetical protein